MDPDPDLAKNKDPDPELAKNKDTDPNLAKNKDPDPDLPNIKHVLSIYIKCLDYESWTILRGHSV